MRDVETKVCSKCGEELPMTSEYFRVTNKFIFRCECRKCEKEYTSRYRLTHKVASVKKCSQGIKKCKECGIELNTDNCYKNNGGKYFYTLCKKCSNAKNNKKLKERYNSDIEFKEKVKQNALNYYNSMGYNERKLMISKRKKTEAFKINHVKSKQMRRARESKLAYTFSISEWEYCKMKFDNKCAYCGRESPLHQEHFIALSKSGEYTHNNILPACRSCNASKNNKDFFEWYPKYRHYSKKREKFILEYLNYKNNKQQLALAL